jgi:putative ABC transport system substrate-binding protein
MLDIRRRKFIALIGGAAAWSMVARAQQAMPVIGYLATRSLESDADLVAAFRQSLAETGFVEGQNLRIEYRFAQGLTNRLPRMAADLVAQHVAAIVATAAPAARAAKEATTTIPVVFSTGSDPISDGLIASFNHPGGNLTGATTLSSELGTKQFELLQELIPAPAVIGYLHDPFGAESQLKDMEKAVAHVGHEWIMIEARTEREIDAGFMKLVERRVGGLLVGASAVFTTWRKQIVVLANHYSIPSVYFRREFADAGGLVSYGTSFVAAYHQIGTYTGRILKGEKPADLPVMQPTKFELVVNSQTAKALRLDVPAQLLARADEVIEQMKRRDFITLLGGAAALPVAARGQGERV